MSCLNLELQELFYAFKCWEVRPLAWFMNGLFHEGSFTPEIYYVWTLQSLQSQKMGAQPIIELSVRAKVDQLPCVNGST